MLGVIYLPHQLPSEGWDIWERKERKKRPSRPGGVQLLHCSRSFFSLGWTDWFFSFHLPFTSTLFFAHFPTFHTPFFAGRLRVQMGSLESWARLVCSSAAWDECIGLHWISFLIWIIYYTLCTCIVKNNIPPLLAFILSCCCVQYLRTFWFSWMTARVVGPSAGARRVPRFHSDW